MDMKIWNKRRALRWLAGVLWLLDCLSLALRLASSLRMPGWSCCSCLHFSMDCILDGKELSAQPRIQLVWQKVSGLFFSGCSSGDDLWGRNLTFFQNCVAFVSNVVLVCKLPNFLDYKTHFPPPNLGGNGGMSYSTNVAYIYVGEILCYLCY